MFYTIHLDTNNWSRVPKYIVQYSLAVAQAGREHHSTGFDQAKPSIVKLIVFSSGGDILSIDSNKKKITLALFYYYFIISYLDTNGHEYDDPLVFTPTF